MANPTTEYAILALSDIRRIGITTTLTYNSKKMLGNNSVLLILQSGITWPKIANNVIGRYMKTSVSSAAAKMMPAYFSARFDDIVQKIFVGIV